MLLLLIQAVQSTGNKVLSFEELQALGRKKVVAPEPPKPSDLSTIMYTSGTTGNILLSCLQGARCGV